MFNFTENIYSHMPFVAHGKSPDFAPKQFCCIMIDGKWKLHYFDGDMWKRIDTGLPEDATECSPCAEYEPITGKWSVSYIAGGYEGAREFYLYLIDDIDNPKPKKIIGADVGFVFKNRLVFGGRMGPIFISENRRDRALTFTDAEYLYRVSYNPNNPNELLVSGQNQSGELFSRVYNIFTRKLYVLTVNGEPAYKAAFFNGYCYYAQRNSIDDYEDRRIVKAEAFSLTELDSSLVLEFDI